MQQSHRVSVALLFIGYTDSHKAYKVAYLRHARIGMTVFYQH